MGQIQSVISCMPWSCTRAGIANGELVDPPYGAAATAVPVSSGRARSRGGSVGSADMATPGISNTEASSYARASQRRSLSSDKAAAVSARGDVATAARTEDVRIGKNTFSQAYVRKLVAWSEAGESGSMHARKECALFLLCMQPGDVLIHRDDGKLEFLVKRLWGGSADYDVIPVPWPPGETRFWPPVTWVCDAGTALRAVAGADHYASDRPPLPPAQEWADEHMLEAALRSEPNHAGRDLAGNGIRRHISDIARKQIRATAYLVRSKYPRGLRDVAHASVWLPVLTAAHPSRTTARRTPPPPRPPDPT